jgi:hypothetical protein
LQLSACETAKGLFLFGPKSGSIQTAYHEQELIVWKGLMHRDGETGLRCCCVWERRSRGGCSAKRVDEAKLVDRQMKRAVVRASVDRDVAVGREDNGERGSVGGGDARQSEDNGLARENGGAINRHDISTDVLASHVADSGSRGTGGNAGQITAFANVASGDLETKRRVITLDCLRDGVEAVKWIIGDFKVHGRQRRAVGRDDTVGSQEAESLDIWGGVREIVHTFVETSVCGRFDERTREIKIIQDFESARIPKKNTKARVRNDASIACRSGTHVDTATEGA